jgi:hypothetical protein
MHQIHQYLYVNNTQQSGPAKNGRARSSPPARRRSDPEPLAVGIGPDEHLQRAAYRFITERVTNKL